jgi:hypothetical protein
MKTASYIILGFTLCTWTVASDERSAGVADSGNGFLSACQYSMSEDSYTAGLCLGYVRGVSDAVDALYKLTASARPEAIPLFCIPKGGTNQQILDIAIKFVKEHPEKRHAATKFLILDSLIEAFPCSASSK